MDESDYQIQIDIKNNENMLQSILNKKNIVGVDNFGLCVSCGKEIHTKRLAALPQIKTCIDCANDFN